MAADAISYAHAESLLSLIADKFGSEGLEDGKNGCINVWYCRGGNFKYKGHNGILPRRNVVPGSGEITEEGCVRFKCGALGLNNVFTCPNESFIHEGGEINNCMPRMDNVFELYQKYLAFKSNDENIQYTGLGQFLEDNGDREEAKCAFVVYCSNDLTYILSNIGSVTCGAPIYCGTEFIGETCSSGAVHSNNGELLGYRTLCLGRNTYNLCSPSVKISGRCDPPQDSIIMEYDLNDLPEDIEAALRPIRLAAKNFTAWLGRIFENARSGGGGDQSGIGCPVNLVSGEEEELSIKVMIDSFQNETLWNFGIDQSDEGGIGPDGLIKSSNGMLVDDFDPYGNKVFKEAIPDVEFFVNDWDYEHIIYLEPIEAGKESRLIFEDTTLAWANHISSDSLFSVGHLSSKGYDILVGGSFGGALIYDSVAVAQTDSLAAFLLRISKDGVLENIHILDNITGEVAFSENRRKSVVMAAKHRGNALMNGSPIASQGGFVVLRIDSLDQVKAYGDIREGQSLELLDVSYAPDTSGTGAHVALALLGSGALTVNGQQVFNHAGDQMNIISLDTTGNYNWHTATPSDSMNTARFDLTYGPDNQLFVGMTRHSPSAPPDKADMDISLSKMDAQGNTVWEKWYGTQEDETVSRVLFNHGVLYFGGEFTGSVGDKTIGKYVFSNLVETNSKAYISYVVDEELQRSLEDNAVLRSEEDQKDEPSFQEENSRRITVYPNPFNDKLYIKTSGLSVESIEIVNYLGQVLHRFDAGAGDLNNLEVDFAREASGFYFVKVYGEGGVLIGAKRVIKQN